MIYSFYAAPISYRQTSEKELSPFEGLCCGVLNSVLLAALWWESELNSSQLWPPFHSTQSNTAFLPGGLSWKILLRLCSIQRCFWFLNMNQGNLLPASQTILWHSSQYTFWACRPWNWTLQSLKCLYCLQPVRWLKGNAKPTNNGFQRKPPSSVKECVFLIMGDGVSQVGV